MIYCLRGAGAYAHSAAGAFGMVRAFGNVYIHFARLCTFSAGDALILRR